MASYSTGVEQCSTLYVRPGEISWEADDRGQLAGFFIYGDGQRIRLSIEDARMMRTVLAATLDIHDAGEFPQHVRKVSPAGPNR